MLSDILEELPVEVFVLGRDDSCLGWVVHDDFNYDLNNNKSLMLRLFNTCIRYSYRPKIMNINYLVKRQAQTAKEEQPQLINQGEGRQEQMKRRTKVGLHDLNKAINTQDNLTRIELQINHQIKIETKATNLYYLHKSRRIQMTTKNLVNLLVKVLQLRQVNPSQSQQSQKFDLMLSSISKKLPKFAPEDMIRFLFCIKTVRMNPADIKKLYPFISAILGEFLERSQILKSQEESTVYSSFEVISIESNLKLLHSLKYLHYLSGGEFQPSLTTLIQKNLEYFHSLMKQLGQSDFNNPIRKMKFTFYFGLLNEAASYDMPLPVIKDFINIINSCKKINLEKSSLFFEMATHIMKNPMITKYCRGQNVKKNSEVFKVFRIINDLFDDTSEMVKLHPKYIIKHLENLNSFTESELRLLELEEVKQKTVQKVMQFTLKTYEKHWNRSYLTTFEKESIENWVYLCERQRKEYLASLLLMIHQYMKRKERVDVALFNKLMNMCIQSFSEQTFCTKAAVLLIAFQRGLTNVKNLVDFFLTIPGLHPKKTQEFKQINYFKKSLGVELYTSLFQFWDKIREASRLTVEPYRQGTYFKILMKNISNLEDISSFSKLISKRILLEPELLNIFIAKYKRVNQENKLLSSNVLITVQTNEFKKNLQTLQLLQTERCDRKKLSKYFYVHYTIRIKIKRCLLMFKMSIQIFQLLSRSKGNENNIFECQDFIAILQCFDDQFRYLVYKQLFTREILGLLAEISHYLQEKGKMNSNLKISEIWNWMKEERLHEKCQSPKNLLAEIENGGVEKANVVGKTREQGEDQETTEQ